MQRLTPLPSVLERTPAAAIPPGDSIRIPVWTGARRSHWHTLAPDRLDRHFIAHASRRSDRPPMTQPHVRRYRMHARPEARSGDGRALWCKATASGWAAAPAGGNQSAAGAVRGRRVGALCVGGDRPAVPIRIRLVTDARLHAHTNGRPHASTRMHMHTPTPTPSHAQARKTRPGGARMPVTHPLCACVRTGTSCGGSRTAATSTCACTKSRRATGSRSATGQQPMQRR